MDMQNITSILESILFSSGEPIKISKIAKIIGVEQLEVENSVAILSTEYAASQRGLTLLKKEDEIQLVTKPENAAFVEQLVKGELQEALSQAALEVLSIIAYRGPLTRSDIEMIRGVNCSYTLRNLLMRGLIERVNNPKDSRGYLYKISFDLLKKLGIESIEKLPDFETLSHDERIESIVNQNSETEKT